MNASSGIRFCRERTKVKMPAPTKVNPRLIQYAPLPCGSMPTRIAMVAPSAAICASARSTKITPRSTTCTPRYACIPVRIRLATNGQIRKGRISIGLLEPLLRRLECLAQQSNIVIKQFEVVRHVFFAAHRRQVLDDLPTRFASNGLRSFQVEIRLNQDQLAVLPL